MQKTAMLDADHPDFLRITPEEATAPTEMYGVPLTETHDQQVLYPSREGYLALLRTSLATMAEALQNLEKVTNRRKALIWVSEGYDFNPFQESRLGLRDTDLRRHDARGDVDILGRAVVSMCQRLGLDPAMNGEMPEQGFLQRGMVDRTIAE